ncbi:MAG: adenosylmethionine decarboxylase [archaeon]|nr:adenosylmethionine decarboxylase [archaeon]
MVFGMHLTLDCYKCNQQKLNDLNIIYEFLNNMPGEIGMTRISRPSVIRYEGGGWDKGGITGFVLLAESHISIHTFPDHGFFTADVYTCSEFDAEKTAKRIADIFESKVVEKNVVIRGQKLNKETLMVKEETVE